MIENETVSGFETSKIEKVSDVTEEVLASYLRLDEITDDEKTQLTTFLKVAQSYISSYTGVSRVNMDNHPDFVLALLVLCQDMYDNRTMYVDNKKLNTTVQNILDMHRENLL